MFPVPGELRGFSRRTAEISIPGITEPQIVTGITIPIGPVNQSATTNPGQSGLSRKQREDRFRDINRRLKEQLQESEIEAVDFSLYTTEEIDFYAVVNISSTEEEGTNTVKDLRMGPHGEGADCPTCGSDLYGCPGHMGKIIIPPIMHPLTVETISLVLSCICKTCSFLLVTADDLISSGIDRVINGTRHMVLRDKPRLDAIKNLIHKINDAQNKKQIRRECQHNIFGHGGISCESNPIYNKSKAQDGKRDYRLGMYRKRGSDFHLEGYLYPDEIFQRLNAVPDEDAQLLGFSNNSHPRTMIMERLVVIPYNARPDMFQGELHTSDDLTKIYREIVRETIKYNRAINLSDKENAHAQIFKLIKHLIKNDGKLNQGDLKIQSDIRTRIQGKPGIIRGNLMGKRVNFAGRTVVGPAHYLRVDEIGIPRLMSVKLTRPIRVYEANRAEMQTKYDSGKVTYIIRQNGRDAGVLKMIGDQFREKHPDYQVQFGDIVHRMLEDGDVVLVNRQPTLHKQNILALYTRIIDDRIVRINLSITTPLNGKLCH